MRYTYAYKTSDGTRHEEAVDAPSREAAFAALRKRGIRPIKVVAADGSKANGEVRGGRGRAAALAAAAALLAGGVALWMGGREAGGARTRQGAPLPVATPRHQIYGDPAIVGGFERGRFEDVLPRPGDRLLAWFAQPGRLTCPKGVSPARLRRLSDGDAAALCEAARSDVPVSTDAPREVRELVQVVNGIRAEMRAYLANGNGTVRSFWRRLVERTEREAQIYARTRRELEGEPDLAVWERRNEALRALGLRTIPNPHEAE